jgi:predicted ribosome quality control (RQC) complex YloA/Tae2 family protein
MIEAFVSRTGELDIEGLLHFRDDLIDGRLSFYLALPDRLGNAAPVPVPLPAGEGLLGPFSSGEEACLFVGERLLERAFEKIIQRHARPLRKRLASRAALRLRLEDDLRAAQDHPRMRREAEILAAYQTRVRQGASSVELPDPYETDTTVTISLDPAIPIREQIRKRFNRASKLERSVERIRRRLGEVEGEISALEDAQGILRGRESFPERLRHLERVIAEAPTPLAGRKRGTRKPGERVFRRFDLDAMWFVLVGRNNQENDELTFRVAGPEDLWLHAQHTPCSHVILKSKGASGGPPAKVLAAAAGIAAYFSRARHASLVPVIYTHRKYVRKPRGAAPGKVLCEREKTIFAEPVLPSVGDEEPESV